MCTRLNGGRPSAVFRTDTCSPGWVGMDGVVASKGQSRDCYQRLLTRRVLPLFIQLSPLRRCRPPVTQHCDGLLCADRPPLSHRRLIYNITDHGRPRALRTVSAIHGAPNYIHLYSPETAA